MYQAVLIDDEPFIVDGLESAIDWSGYHIEICYAATDSRDALEYILNHPVHIVITDVSMPHFDGLQLIQRIKDEKPSVYVIVLSAYDNFEYVQTALKLGAENYLLKPLDSDDLSDTISHILSHLQEREQLSSTYGRTMLTFRSAFTEEWLKNLLTGTELVNKANLLGINLDAPAFTAVIFSCPSAAEINMSIFFDLLLRYLPGQFTGNFYFETPRRLVGVLSPVGERTEDIASFIPRVLKAAANSGCPVFISAGKTVNHYSKVHNSYQQADFFAFFEYTGLPYLFYEGDTSLSDTVSKALDCYDRSTQKNMNPIQKLYENCEAHTITAHLLSYRLRTLSLQEYQLSSKYPELTDVLAAYPPPGSDQDTYLSFVEDFLKASDHHLVKMQQSTYPVVDAVIKAVHEFSDQNISLKTLASNLHVTPAYLGTIFRQQTGYYFNDYLTEARLKYAAYLLENTDTKIKEITEKTGFASQTYFNRSFKRYYNTSPANYRRSKSVNNLLT